jgi:hypothetical protein
MRTIVSIVSKINAEDRIHCIGMLLRDALVFGMLTRTDGHEIARAGKIIAACGFALDAVSAKLQAADCFSQ